MLAVEWEVGQQARDERNVLGRVGRGPLGQLLEREQETEGNEVVHANAHFLCRRVRIVAGEKSVHRHCHHFCASGASEGNS